MTMKFTQLRTYWTTDEAECVISFLDELRDQLWTVYGDDIVAMYQAESNDSTVADPAEDNDFDNEIDF